MSRRPRIAVLSTVCFPLSHGHVLTTMLIEGTENGAKKIPSRCDVAAIHQMQISDDDLGVDLARRHGVPMFSSIATALCLGGDNLAVDGVVIIGEHGDFPFNEQGHCLYPRREMLDQVLAVFRQSGRSVPIFLDKHLSWNWAWARYMWQSVESDGITMMAGSSIPFAEFSPPLEPPMNRPMDQVVSVAYGSVESYAIHTLELALSVAEWRPGGERGIRRVRCLSGEAVWRAHAAGDWSAEVAEAAFAAVAAPKGRATDYRTSAPPNEAAGVHALDLEHADGLRTTLFLINGYTFEFGFAFRTVDTGEINAGTYPIDSLELGTDGNLPRLGHFSGLVRAIEEMFISGWRVTPLERTLLATGALSHLISSFHSGGAWIDVDDLEIAYPPKVRPPEQV